jgi:hypothetical protein
MTKKNLILIGIGLAAGYFLKATLNTYPVFKAVYNEGVKLAG